MSKKKKGSPGRGKSSLKIGEGKEEWSELEGEGNKFRMRWLPAFCLSEKKKKGARERESEEKKLQRKRRIKLSEIGGANSKARAKVSLGGGLIGKETGMNEEKKKRRGGEAMKTGGQKGRIDG